MSFISAHKRVPNLLKPHLFNDMLLWRILFDRRPELAWTCDKLEMKRYAIERSAYVLVPEVLWTGQNLDDLVNVALDGDWVLKLISGTGQVHFGQGNVNDDEMDIIREKTQSWINGNRYTRKRSWALSMGQAGYLIERRLSQDDLIDYKFHVFSGQAGFCGIVTDRIPEVRLCMVDIEGNPLPTLFGYPNPDTPPLIPSNWPDMVRLANQLSNGCDYIRVDLYSVNGKIFLGEFTPYSSMALDALSNKKYEEIWGSLWTLPSWRTVLFNRYRRQ